MQVEINESDRGPKFLIVDRPSDDEWIDITEFRDVGERLVGKQTGDILEVQQHEGRAVAFRRKVGTAPHA